MKKLIALLLALIMVLSLVACGSSGGSEAPADGAANEGNADSTGEIYEVVMQYPTFGTTPADLQMVEDAINARTEPEIGVHVTFYPVMAFDLNSTTNLMVSSGEKLDLAMSMFEGGVGGYVNKGALIELDDLVAEYGQGIVAAEGVAMAGGYFGGKLYGVPTEEKLGRVKTFFARKDMVEKYNIDYDPEKVYTYEEMSEIFATVKAGEGNTFYCIGTSAGEDPIYAWFDPVDYLGASMASGVLMNYGVGTDEIVNYYASENFAEACNYARQWYKAGYLAPDVNTVTDTGSTQMQSGNYFGYFSSGEPDMIATANTNYPAYIGSEIVAFRVSDVHAVSQNYQSTIWMIPITCDNPEKTMQWLNMMYTDVEIINLLQYGVEGVHYEFRGDSKWEIQYPEGVDGSNVTYMSILNVWGDKSLDYVMPPRDESYYQELKDHNASIAQNSEALGYCFDSEPVKTQLAAVNSVISEYQASLALGVVDPNEVIPEFLSALEAAGINDIIAENQAQYDAWKAAQ